MTILLLALVSSAHAQWQTSHWLHLDGAFAQRELKQTDAVTLTARRAAARGELGLNLLPHLSVSGGAAYQDGVSTTEGRTLIGTAPPAFAAGRVFETRAMLHLLYRPIVISGGIAQLEAVDNLAGAYRARAKFDYKPITVTIGLGLGYVQIEHDLWTKGTTDLLTSDAGGGRGDVSFALAKGAGQGAEVGLIWPNRLVSTKLFVNYHRWSIDAVDAQNDSVESVALPRTDVTELKAGVGLAF